jgi:predicted methyltransferase MtxX (methanogen marker protein 4)
LRPSSPESKKKEFVEDVVVLAEVDAVVRGVRLASVVLLRLSASLRTSTLAAIVRRSSSPAEEFEDGGART